MVAWKNTNAIYQIYPRSFQDSDGDGIGDLKGITSRLGYIKGEADSLGVDAIWISPFFMSPMADFGYDVSDFTAVDPLFGTMADFDELMFETKRRDINVMLDFVPNHTSDQHAWFQQAISGKTSAYRDYYHFRDPGPDGGPPNNWLSVFGGSAWQYDEASGQYYLHSFLKEQPDLNWENPQVQQAMGDALRFWLERGVTGFRFDAIRWMAKDNLYRDNPINPHASPDDDPYGAQIHQYSRYGDRLDAYLANLVDVIDSYGDTVTLFEDYNDPQLPIDDQIKRMYGINATKSAPMNLDLTNLDLQPRNFATSIAHYQRGKGPDADMILCIGNHDKPRAASRYGSDYAKLIGLLQLTIPGLPIIYYGEELGMKDQAIAPHQIRDPFEMRVPGKGLGRDPQRTPMRWSDSPNAGFSDAGNTWLPVGEDVTSINVAAQTSDETSFLALYRRLLQLRRDMPVFRTGKYDPLIVSNGIYVYDVYDDNQSFCVVLNFSKESQSVLLPREIEMVLCIEDSCRISPSSRQVEVGPVGGAVIRYL